MVIIMMRMMIMRMRMMRMMIMTKMMRSLHHISICQGGRWGCGGDGDYEEEDDGNHFWLAAMVDCGWWSPFLLHLSFDDTKFMAGKSMWRGGEFALRRKSQSSDAQKKTSCHRQSGRSQVRSTQRRGLSRTIIFVQERNLGHPASWINSTSKSKVTMQVLKPIGIFHWFESPFWQKS